MASGNPPGPLGITGLEGKINDGTLTRAKGPGSGPVGLSGQDEEEGPTPDALRAQVVAFARQRLGTREGSGECFDLADHALRNAGANSASDFGQVTPNGNYQWGTSISFSQLRPGDIIQFRDYRFERSITEPDGSGTDEFQERPHHTAIVDSIDGGGTVTVLEQNAPEEGDPVTRYQLFFTDSDTTDSGTRTTITVSGTFRFYRPQPRD